MYFQNRIQAVAEPAIPSRSWLISRFQLQGHPSGENSSARLLLAQLAWLSQALATLYLWGFDSVIKTLYSDQLSLSAVQK